MHLAEIVAVDPKYLVAAISPLVAYFLSRFFSPSALLFHSSLHKFDYLINEPVMASDGAVISPTQMVRVASFSVFNAGRSGAENVEIVFNFVPQYLNRWPLRDYRDSIHPDSRYSIILDSLAPKESFGLELLAVNQDLPIVVYVRSKQCQSRERNMTLQVVAPKWMLSLIWLLISIGLMTVVYILLLVIHVG